MNRPDHVLRDRPSGRGEQCEQGGLVRRVEDFIRELELVPDVEDQHMAEIEAAELATAVWKAIPDRFRNNPEVLLTSKSK